MYFKQKSLSSQLNPYGSTNPNYLSNPSRYRNPLEIAKNAQFTDTISLTFYANASAGDQYVEIPLNLPTVPLVSVWHLGCVDKDGAITNGAGTVNGIFNAQSSITGTSIFSGANAGFSINKTTLTIGITSTDVGYGGNFIDAYFKYAIYYDDTEVSNVGL